MAKVMLQTVQRSCSWVSTHLGINRKTQALEPEAVWSVNKRVRIALGKRTRLSPKPGVAFPPRLGSGRGSEQAPCSSPCSYWSRDSWRSLAACMATRNRTVLGPARLELGGSSPWGSWASLSRRPSLLPAPVPTTTARTLCMAASHAVACFLLPCASSPAVSFSWATPSAPGAEYCRDMPVARAVPPGGRRQQAQTPLPTPVQV